MKEIEESHLCCAFCSKKFTAAMMVEYTQMSDGCETCGHGRGGELSLELKCTHCGKVVYKKSGRVDG